MATSAPRAGDASEFQAGKPLPAVATADSSSQLDAHAPSQLSSALEPFVPEWVTCAHVAEECYTFGEDLRVTAQKPQSFFDDGMRKVLAGKHLKADAPGKWDLQASIFTSYLGDDVCTFGGYIATRERDDGDYYDIHVGWRGTVLKEEWVADASFLLVPVQEKKATAAAAVEVVPAFVIKDDEADGSPEAIEKTRGPATHPHLHVGFAKLYVSAQTSTRTLRPGGDAEDGVDRVATTVADIIRSRPGQKLGHVYVTGHSLGGALANISAWRLAIAADTTDLYDSRQVRLVTFSAPRTSNTILAKDMYDRLGHYSYRVFTDGDIVPILPLYSGFASHSEMEPPPKLTKTASTKGFFKDLTSAVHSFVDDKPGNEVDDWLWKTLLTNIRTRMGEPNTPEELILQGMLTAMDNIMPQMTNAAAKGRDPILNAKFCHAGVGVGLTRAALPALFNEVVWEVHAHHNLNLIIYLLQPTPDHLVDVKGDLKVV